LAALPEHLYGPAGERRSTIAARRPLRIAIINVMPRAETYEPFLLRPLATGRLSVNPVWIRLTSHVYGSSDLQHITARYLSFDQALARGNIDGLILTGAPVEELRFEEVHYWPELAEILAHGRTAIPSTLGICWGGLALGRLLGLEKRTFPRKVFGVFEHEKGDDAHPITQDWDDRFFCAHSRHAGFADAEMEAACVDGRVNLLAHGREVGYAIFESRDHRFVAHLGHPEYEAARLALEWERDSSLGRMDVEPPKNFDVARPTNVWRTHCNQLFDSWLRFVARSRAPGAATRNA
jgi:homoserine O-succinyltransferase/O-acetyltransferase